MARVNRWKQFGDAFNAVYNAGTTIGAAIETGGIAMKDYEDEEGNELTGLALDRAKMDDYAAVELKYGDPLKSLKMRTGVEQLGQNRIRTDNLQDDLTSIRGLRDSSTNLNIANTDAKNLDTRIRQATETEEIGANKAAFTMEAARDTGKTTAYNDPSYPAMLIAGQEEDAAQSAANAVRFESQEYKDYLKANDLRNTALAKKEYVDAEIARSIMENPEYQNHFIGSKLAQMKRTYTMDTYRASLAEDPKTFEKMKNELETSLNNSVISKEESEVLRQLAENPTVKANALKAGLASSETLALEAQSLQIQAEKQLRLNKFIQEWNKTSDPSDPSSMLKFVEGIKAIDPERGMALATKYGEHQLWEITNNSLLIKAEANNALIKRGADGVREILDKYNGDKLGVRLDKGKDGSYQLVETRDVGPGGEGSKQTEVVRVIAQGKDETEFMADVNAVLDPASIMEYSMNLVEMRYKQGVTDYNEALTKNALAKKPLTMDQWVASIIQDPKASTFDKEVALAVALKDMPPEVYEKLVGIMNIDSKAKEKGVTNDSAGPKLENDVDVNGPKTEEEKAVATSLLEILSNTNSTATERETALAGNNRKVLAKYYPQALVMEDNKADAAKEFVEALDKGDITLNKAGLDELIETLVTRSEAPKRAGQGSKSDSSNKANAKRLADFMSNNQNAANTLGIVISELQTRIRDIAGLSKSASRNSGAIKKKNSEIADQIKELQELIKRLSQDR